MRPNRFLALPFLCLAAAPAGEIPALILSEVLADPAARPDAQGEFLELGNPRPDSVALDSAVVSVDGQTLSLGRLALGPGSVFLVCRDSSAYGALGVVCDRGWSALSLANGRALELEASWAGGDSRARVPSARPGTSWENTWDGGAGFADFQPGRAGAPGMDSATPGARNSRSVRPAARDLALVRIEASGSTVRVTVDDSGSAPPPGGRVALRLDADWDGRAETGLDSIGLDPAAPFPQVVSFPIADAAGRLEASLGPDEDPGNNSVSMGREPEGGPLAFGASRPAPGPGEPEWVEIRNATGTGRGPARRISLASAALGGIPFGAKAGALDPGERAILTPDTGAFLTRHGPLKAKVLKPEGWRSLRNTGDTLVLSLAGLPVDTLAWARAGQAVDAAGAAPPERAGWTLSGRTAFPEAPLAVEVSAPPGDEYVLRAFDLEGNCVREIGRGGAGRRAHAWNGRGGGERALPRGAYVLCLSFATGQTRKRAIAAGER